MAKKSKGRRKTDILGDSVARETNISKEKCMGCFAKAMEFYRQAEAELSFRKFL